MSNRSLKNNCGWFFQGFGFYFLVYIQFKIWQKHQETGFQIFDFETFATSWKWNDTLCFGILKASMSRENVAKLYCQQIKNGTLSNIEWLLKWLLLSRCYKGVRTGAKVPLFCLIGVAACWLRWLRCASISFIFLTLDATIGHLGKCCLNIFFISACWALQCWICLFNLTSSVKSLFTSWKTIMYVLTYRWYCPCVCELEPDCAMDILLGTAWEV